MLYKSSNVSLYHIAAFFLFQSQISKTEGMTEKVIPSDVVFPLRASFLYFLGVLHCTSDVVYPLWAFFLLKNLSPWQGRVLPILTSVLLSIAVQCCLSMSTPCRCLYTYGNVVAYINSMPLSVIFISLLLYKSPTACL